MGIVKKSITVTEEQAAWVKAQVEAGKFGNDSEVYRSIVRQAQEAERREAAFYAAIEQGQNSGISDKQVPDIIKDMKTKLRASGRLTA